MIIINFKCNMTTKIIIKSCLKMYKIIYFYIITNELFISKYAFKIKINSKNTLKIKNYQIW